MFFMYRIIGADGKEYGPVTLEQLRQWVAEGRATAQTAVQAEGIPGWKPLAQFPELVGNAVPPMAGGRPMTGADRKIAAGVCGILLGWLGIHKFVLGYTGAGVTMVLVSVLTCGLGAGVMGVIGLVEGIIYLTKSDTEFVATYVTGRKEWF